MDAEVPAKDVVRDPVQTTRSLDVLPHDQIKAPKDIFGPSRMNSKGLDLASSLDSDKINLALEAVQKESFFVSSLLPFEQKKSETKEPVINPAKTYDVLGYAESVNAEDLDQCFAVAKTAQRDWDARGGKARAEILKIAADLLEARMLRLIALLVREAGKTQDDAIAEVREAVDFCRYYAYQAAEEFSEPKILPGVSGETNSLTLCGRGVFVAISPWNFPLAIFIGQTVAALAAGNSVLTKPAPQTPIIAYEAVNILFEAGVPKEVLILILGDGPVGAELIGHQNVAGVVFTGSTATAKKINQALALKDGPIVPLIAETGGQNVMFVDSTALLEQVTDDVIQSAFKSAGQRCSALRVLYLQTDIADKAIQMIKGAMDMLDIGDPYYLNTEIGPIIDKDAVRSLEAHILSLTRQDKLLHATRVSQDKVQGTFVPPHMFEIEDISELKQEHFGPILHIIRYEAADLEAALRSAFSTGFGLTLGIHTRMDRRWAEVFKMAPVGNTYVNRNITGAVVGSQPFGGQGLSGTGFKAGGPHYLYRFSTEKTLTVNTMASGGNTELLTLD